MPRKTDLPDEIPPTESQVVSKIEAALERVINDLGLNPDQKSIKYEKYVYLTASEFSSEERPAISYSWFRWGISTLAGQGGQTTTQPLYTTKPAAARILDAEPTQIEDYLKEDIHELSIQEWWESPTYDFLKHFYEKYADKYRRLYLANVEVHESLEFVENTIQRGEDLVTDQTYRLACEWTHQLETEVGSLEEISEDYDKLKYFTEIYRDTLLSLAGIPGEEIGRAQKTAINQLADLYKEIVWPILAHGLSIKSAKGPNRDKIEQWASGNRDRLREEFADTSVGEICEFAGLLREFKKYPEITDMGQVEDISQSHPVSEIAGEIESYPTIYDFVQEYSLSELAAVVDLTPEFSEGKITHRGVANAAGISYEAAFNLLEVLVPLVDQVREPQRIRPGDIDEETREELLSGVDI